MRRWLSAAAVAGAIAVAMPRALAQAPEDVDSAASGIRAELGEGFRVDVLDGPFVLASNAGEALTRRAAGTIGGVYAALYRDFMTRRPSRPVRVYCFGDKASYEAYVRRTYGREPSTPFGFYSAGDRRMVMNVATGTGTLAHEMVHPLIAEDFPGVPAWFNEGFASLFEQSTWTAGGGVRGLTNWRLAGLQEALRGGAAPSLKEVVGSTSEQFYGRRSGINYAVARYLCYFLQEHGGLREFYAEFKRTAARDPTGRAALEAVVGVPIAEIQGRWERFVGKLRFGDE